MNPPERKRFPLATANEADLQVVAKALRHPLRRAFMRLATNARGALSIAALAARTGANSATVHYHVGVLHDADILEVAERIHTGGTEESRYRIGGGRGGIALAVLSDGG